jgi:MFS family permease
MLSWFLMGFANLLVLPLRIEHLSSSSHPTPFSTAEIAFIVGVVPTAGRLLSMPMWGFLFDRVNFLKLRVILNVGLAVGIYVFFVGDSYVGLILGSLIHGVASGGGDVSWGLWVTKFAPSRRVADYMSVHTFFSGIRGLIAPLLGFHLLAMFTPENVAAACALVIVLANAPLVWEQRTLKANIAPA